MSDFQNQSSKAIVRIPKDPRQIKSKFFMGLTRRQALFFGTGTFVGVAVFGYFITHGLGSTISLLAMMVMVFPIAVLGLFQRSGMYLDEYIRLILRFKNQPRLRLRRWENRFAPLLRYLENLERKRGQNDKTI